MEPEEFYWIDENGDGERKTTSKSVLKSPSEDTNEKSSEANDVPHSAFSILPAVGGWFSSIAKQLSMSKDYFIQQLKKAEEFPHLDIDESSDECLEMLRKHKDLPGKVHMHYRKPGETLESIASYYGMEIELLKEINQIQKEEDIRSALFVYKTDRFFASRGIEYETEYLQSSPKHAETFSENALYLSKDFVITGTLLLSCDYVQFRANEDEKPPSPSHQQLVMDVLSIEKLLTSTVLPFPGQKTSQFGDLKYIHIIGRGKELHLMVPQHSLIIEKLENTLHMKLVEDPDSPKTPMTSPQSDRQTEAFGEDHEAFQKYLVQTAILTIDQFKKLSGSLPYRFRSLTWKLVYSTLRDGISLKTFYEKTYNCGPTLLVVQDVEHNVFGAFATESWRIHSRYFGTGESFLFTFYPEFNVYHWTHQNSYFMLAKADSIAIGGGEHFGLWLDSDFQHGSTARSETFNNRCLTSAQDFDCIHLECWSFEQ